MRAALLALALALPGPLAAQSKGCAPGDGIYLTRVCFVAEQRTQPYGHDILGGTPEWTGMTIAATAIGMSALKLPNKVTGISLGQSQLIFEDIAPRLQDISGDGLPDIVTVISGPGDGASLTVYDLATGTLASTTPIGQSYRWLAPVGIADFDDDGRIDIAYVDRPHLAKTLRIVSYTETSRGPRLSEVDNLEGLTNHRIGDAFIQGGVATCGGAPVIYTADADWKNIVATEWTGREFASKPVARYAGPDSFTRFLTCAR